MTGASDRPPARRDRASGPQEPAPAGRIASGALPSVVRGEAERMLADQRFPPDPERIAAGWERRFIAFGARADEMMQLYRDLGFEVVADPVDVGHLDRDCDDCRLIVELGFKTLYTRRPRT